MSLKPAVRSPLRPVALTALERALLASGVAGGLAPYLGQVATRSYVPNVISGGSNYIMSRTAHTAAQAITSLQVAFPGFACSGTNGVEAATAAANVYTASIEYPANTFTQVTWSASASTTATGGSITACSRPAPRVMR